MIPKKRKANKRKARMRQIKIRTKKMRSERDEMFSPRAPRNNRELRSITFLK